jgi:hypothetical protein
MKREQKKNKLQPSIRKMKTEMRNEEGKGRGRCKGWERVSSTPCDEPPGEILLKNVSGSQLFTAFLGRRTMKAKLLCFIVVCLLPIQHWWDLINEVSLVGIKDELVVACLCSTRSCDYGQ